MTVYRFKWRGETLCELEVQYDPFEVTIDGGEEEEPEPLRWGGEDS